MASATDLAFRIAADVSALQSNMKNVEAVVGQTMKTVESMSKSAMNYIEKITVGVAAAWSVDKFMSGIDGAVKSAAALNNLSIRSGVTVESLSSLGAAAKASGTDMETIAKNAAKLGKAEMEAAQGNEKTAAIFKSLGVSYADGNGKLRETGDTMIDVAKKLFDLESATKRVALAQQIFGKSGYELLPFLKQLADTSEFQVKLTSDQAFESEKLLQSQAKLDARNSMWIKMFTTGITPVWRDFNEALLQSDSLMGKFGKTVKQLQEDGSIGRWAEESILYMTRFMDGIIFIKRAVEDFGKLIGASFAVAGVAIGHFTNQFSQAWDKVTNPKSWGDGISDIWGKLTTKRTDTASPEYSKDNSWMSVQTQIDEIWGSYAKDRDKIFENPRAFESAFVVELGKRRSGLKTGKPTGLGDYNPIEDLSSAAAPSRETRTQWQSYMDSLIEQTTKIEQGEYAAMIAHAERLANFNDAQNGLPKADLAAAKEIILKLNNIKADAFQTNYAESLDKETEAMERQNQMLEMSTVDREKYSTMLKQAQKLQESITSAEKSGLIASADAANKDTTLMQQRMQMIDFLTNKTRTAADDQIKAIEYRYNKERELTYGAVKALQDYAEQATNQAANIQNAIGNTFRGLEDALVKFTTTGKMDFKSMVDSILNDIARIQVRENITGPLAKFLGGAVGGDSVLIPGIDYSNISLPSWLGKATGGPVNSGQPYVVGERGPEWFVPDSSGTIIPNGAKAMMATAGANVRMEVHIHEAPGMTARVQQSTGAGGAPRMDVFLLQAVENGISRNISRGAGLASVLEGRYGLSPAAGLI
ncbi:MAG: hypothetical protein HQL95_01710 [Magnetococcales bacterium]|nr:hypothetical protein [Magnetococcales bacterium]